MYERMCDRVYMSICMRGDDVPSLCQHQRGYGSGRYLFTRMRMTVGQSDGYNTFAAVHTNDGTAKYESIVVNMARVESPLMVPAWVIWSQTGFDT